MSNMYSKSVAQWNVFAGCLHGCKYCVKSFQAQAKRQKHNCMKCYTFAPHEHPERLAKNPPRTKAGEFIFACASGDVSFASHEYRQAICDRMAELPDRTFLLQSKAPICFCGIHWPPNVILGTTLETACNETGKEICPTAPLISTRVSHMIHLHHARKMVTVEPIMEGDMVTLLNWIVKIDPEMVWVGFDSKACQLPEPSPEAAQRFVDSLREKGLNVIKKKWREAQS